MAGARPALKLLVARDGIFPDVLSDALLVCLGIVLFGTGGGAALGLGGGGGREVGWLGRVEGEAGPEEGGRWDEFPIREEGHQVVILLVKMVHRLDLSRESEDSLREGCQRSKRRQVV